MRTCVPVLAAVLIIALTSPAFAGGPLITFEFADGTEKSAEVERVVNSGNESYFVVIASGRSTNYFFRDLKPASVYRAWTAIAENDDVATHIAIGAYCSEHGLTEEAVRELTEAREIAEKLERRAHDMLAASRKDAAQALYREAKRQEALGDTDSALKLYARIWSYYYWDAEDIRTEVEAAIRSLATHPDPLIDKRAPKPADHDNGNAAANNNAGNNNAGNPPANPAEELDDQTDFRSAQKAKYRRTLSATVEAENDLKRAMAKLGEARRLEVMGADDPSAALYLAARKDFTDLRERIIRDLIDKTHDDDWEWMPLLRRKIDGLVTRLDRELLAVARARMHYYARRAPDHQINMTNAEKWCNSVLALRPDDDEALRVRMKLTELALQRR